MNKYGLLEVKMEVGTILLLWHLVARGTRQADIFIGRDDKRIYMAIFRRIALEMGIPAACFVLMDNHIHFLIQAAREDLGRLFQRVHTVYARIFNERHSFQGRMFETDFRPFPIRNEAHLAATAVYIIMNVVRDLGIARPEEYGFCSYGAFLQPGRSAGWLDPTPFLRVFDPDPAVAREKYRRAVEFRASQILSKRNEFLGNGKAYPARCIQEYTDAELKMVLSTLMDPAALNDLADRAGIPSQAFTLYSASQMGLGSFRRLCALLGISRKLGKGYVEEIAEDQFLRSHLESARIVTGISAAACA
jgi:REP element-mobilizing transposase RayT